MTFDQLNALSAKLRRITVEIDAERQALRPDWVRLSRLEHMRQNLKEALRIGFRRLDADPRSGIAHARITPSAPRKLL